MAQIRIQEILWKAHHLSKRDLPLTVGMMLKMGKVSLQEIKGRDHPSHNNSYLRGRKLTYHAKWTASKYNIAFDIGPLPTEEGSVLQWKDGVTKHDYEQEVSENDEFKNIPYSKTRTLPTLSIYVKYEYGAIVDDELKKVEAQFLGWATKKGAGEPEYSAGHVVRRLSDKDGDTVTLYPVWGAPHYKLVLDPNGGKVTKPITGYQAGDAIDLTDEVPSRPGYEFGGWYNEKLDDDADVTGKTPVTSIPADEFGDKTYYAYWTAKEYKYTLKGIDLATGNPTEESWQPEENLKVGQTATLGLPVKTEDNPSTEDVDETEYYITPPTGKELAGWTEEYLNEEGENGIPLECHLLRRRNCRSLDYR